MMVIDDDVTMMMMVMINDDDPSHFYFRLFIRESLLPAYRLPLDLSDANPLKNFRKVKAYNGFMALSFTFFMAQFVE